ncbi:hypothetical protein [uncultured Pseudoteredinibacter sp.]|uniref:PA4575 family protein n=1 Tax=uncultured Pseudoteredinibacter sp. TaxID=1641701 RepID=UPI00260762B8|nr:hypothetical protein [uncultured Pseudoteredinibacter sp.]
MTMRLNYLKLPQIGTSVVLLAASGKRIELHIKPVEDGLYSLIALGGISDEQPHKVKSQGPYHRCQQALGAANAIINALISRGYCVSETVAQWQIPAQRQLRKIRDKRRQHAVSYTVEPV